MHPRGLESPMMDKRVDRACNCRVRISITINNRGMHMTRTRTWSLIALASLFCAAPLRAQQVADATGKAVTALEYQWLQSQKTNNPDLVAPLLADRIVSTGEDGRIMNKAQMLADAKATRYASADYEDVKVTVFGDTAIATGGFRAVGTDASGKPMKVHERWTDTWVKMPDGKWQIVATQGSALKD